MTSKVFMLIVISCIFTISLHSQGEDSTISVGVPEISVSHTAFDYGQNLYYKPIVHTFEVKNTGTAPLIINLGKVSCGCTVQKIKTTEIPPGGMTEVEVGYTPRKKEKQPGLQNFTSELMSNDPKQPSVLLSLTGTLVNVVQASTDFLDFTSLKDNQSITKPIHIDIFREEVFTKIESISVNSPLVEIGIPVIESSPTRKRYTYDITLSPKALPRDLKTMFINIKTDSHRVPALEIPIRYTPKSALTISPSKALFGIVPSGSQKTKLLSLKPQQEGVHVAHVKCDSKVVDFSLITSKDTNSQSISVTLKPQDIYEKPTTLKSFLNLYDHNQVLLAQIPIHAIFTNPKK